MKYGSRFGLSALATLLLLGCAKGRELPYDAWELSFFQPPYMDIWVETATVEDVHGRIFFNAGGGIMTAAAAPHQREGWPPNPSGTSRYVDGADFPRRIYVRWQSLVEPQTYEVTLDISQAMRDQMAKSVHASLYPGDKIQRYYYENLVIGLAPGGSVGVWVNGPGFKAIPMMCVQAKVESLGPDLGQYGGRYVTLTQEAKKYLQGHAIPYASWKCDQPPFNASKPKVMHG